MHKYHKIQTIWDRDPETKFKTLIEGQWARPEFEYLQANDWHLTEKVDGTNIRVTVQDPDHDTIYYGGKTDAAQIPPHLMSYLEDTFTLEKMRKAFPDIRWPGYATIYGEGYGAKIQKGGGLYFPDGKSVGFILFDVNVSGVWLERRNVEDIAEKLQIPVVPIISTATLHDAVNIVRRRYIDALLSSEVAEGRREIEGLVMRPTVNLFDRLGRRIISKLKVKDFKNA